MGIALTYVEFFLAASEADVLTIVVAGFEPCILPSLPPSLRRAIPAAPHPDTKFRVVTELPRDVPWKHALFIGTHVLYLHNVPRIQRAAIPAPHRDIALANSCPGDFVVGEPHLRMGDCRARRSRNRPILGCLKVHIVF